VFKGIGKYTGVLQDSAEGFTEVDILDDEDIGEGAKAPDTHTHTHTHSLCATSHPDSHSTK